MGRSNVVHAAASEGGASQRIFEEAERLRRYRRARAGPGLPCHCQSNSDQHRTCMSETKETTDKTLRGGARKPLSLKRTVDPATSSRASATAAPSRWSSRRRRSAQICDARRGRGRHGARDGGSRSRPDLPRALCRGRRSVDRRARCAPARAGGREGARRGGRARARTPRGAAPKVERPSRTNRRRNRRHAA